MSTTVLVSTFSPFPTLAFSAPSETTIDELYGVLSTRYPFLPPTSDLFLAPHSRALSNGSSTLSSLHSPDEALVSLRLTPRMRGGKGGFGSQLRAAGGRMSSQKTSNNDSCRDLSGRRLSTIKEAKKLAEYLEQEPARKKAASEAQRAKLEALERKLGLGKNGGPSGSGEPETLAGKKHRLDDTEYLEQSREIVDNVKNAVAAGQIISLITLNES
ncbi:hypothetical protein HETIRDRAFT_316158 [Heterobasidion irregulare TC 32-1]|uniref:Uncharacterized protein n=1 Tax=Heterobasidion irregulare (strain TC 32-1) TaxID=747525 RepID=W4KCV0_HETIT|nr:uncharacterized protein HETIRDRAFT_316158 [Heterobasidion irregulare TC 32-1]ETW82891.1 hypothetical protein HETIRDRAFT_316158 [Heterobasidion irregulare TC 32-1]